MNILQLIPGWWASPHISTGEICGLKVFLVSDIVRAFAGGFFVYAFLDSFELGKTMFFNVVLR